MDAGKSAVALKIDIGCGPTKKEGYVGMDRIAFKGVDHVIEIGKGRWPFADGSVDEAYSSHCIEHLTAEERIHFANELWRVLKVGGKCEIIAPHWSSCRAYGDPTHIWPPMSEFWLFYLSRKWRVENAPHTDIKNWRRGFKCNFDCTWGYGLGGVTQGRNQEWVQFAMMLYRDVITDLIATITKQE